MHGPCPSDYPSARGLFLSNRFFAYSIARFIKFFAMLSREGERTASAGAMPVRQIKIVLPGEE
jgi:hypothetical protein